jgi:hypothetical protein
MGVDVVLASVRRSSQGNRLCGDPVVRDECLDVRDAGWGVPIEGAWI